MNVGQGLVKASMVLGILTITSACLMTVYLPFIFGGISIILAILSMGEGRGLAPNARLGVILSIIGIVANIVIVASSVYTVFTNPEAYSQFNQMFSQIYGMDFKDMWSQIQNGGDFI